MAFDMNYELFKELYNKRYYNSTFGWYFNLFSTLILKTIVTVSILASLDTTISFHIKTNSSDYITEVVLFQEFKIDSK